MQPGEQDRSAQEVQGSDFVREWDLVGHDGGVEREIEDQVVSAAVLSCGTVDGADLVLCALLPRAGECIDIVFRESLCQALKSPSQHLCLVRRVYDERGRGLPLARLNLVVGHEDCALSVTSVAARADASDHEASDPQEEVCGLDRRRIGELNPGLVDERERAREDAGRRALREAQELVARRPRLWVDRQGHRVVDWDFRGRSRVREENVTRVGS